MHPPRVVPQSRVVPWGLFQTKYRVSLGWYQKSIKFIKNTNKIKIWEEKRKRSKDIKNTTGYKKFRKKQENIGKIMKIWNIIKQ